MAFQYLRIEAKRTAAGILHMLAGTLLLGAILLALCLGASFVLSGSGRGSAPVKIAVSGAGTNAKLILRTLENMESIKDICTFSTVNTKEEAMAALEDGSADAAVLLPENFYRDIMNGTNTPAVICMPKEGVMGTDLFREMVSDGVSLIRSSESGIYAASAQRRESAAKISTEDMDTLLTDVYIRACLNRLEIFRTDTHSVLSGLSLVEYFLSSGLALLLLGLGLNFSFLFTRENRAMEQKLRVYGISPLGSMAVKVLVMAAAEWILLSGVFLFCILFSARMGLLTLSLPVPVLLIRLFPACLMAASFAGLLYTLQSDSIPSLLYLLAGLFMILSSGCILPSAFLPRAVQAAGSVLPLSLWRSYFGSVLFSGAFPALRTGSMLALTLVFLTAAAALADRKGAA